MFTINKSTPGISSLREIALTVILLSAPAFAQDNQSQNTLQILHSQMFYFSVGGGLAFGHIILNAKNTTFSTLEANGAGFQYEARIGVVVWEDQNLILSVDALGRSMSSPTWSLDGTNVYADSAVSASDDMYGIGITKYFVPSNMYLSATFGEGRFHINYSGTRITSHQGFAYHVKGGMEWYIADNWGMGLAIGFAHTAADDQPDPTNASYSGKLVTSRVFAELSVTFN
jgi:hypothetical protein